MKILWALFVGIILLGAWFFIGLKASAEDMTDCEHLALMVSDGFSMDESQRLDYLYCLKDGEYDQMVQFPPVITCYNYLTCKPESEQ